MASITIGKHTVYYDDEDQDIIDAYTWHVKNHKGKSYVLVNRWNAGRYLTIRLHRLIMRAPKGKEIDHVNGNGLDNRRRNLRVCSRSENCKNRSIGTNNTSGYKGVHRNSRGKWIAQLQVDGRKLYLGSFDSPREAALAYDGAATKHHGTYANTNNTLLWAK